MTVFGVQVMRRYSDLDPLGHVNNVVYHDYLQEARVWVLTHVFGGKADEIDQVVARQEMTHLRPLRFDAQPITIDTWISRLGGASYDFSYRIVDERGIVAAKAITQMVFFDSATETPRRIPDDQRALLCQHLQDADDA